MAVAAIAALSSCSDKDLMENATLGIEPAKQPLVFTATMEGAPQSRATFDNTAKCASLEVNDQININGQNFKAITAGTSTIFSESFEREVRPTYVNSTTFGHFSVNEAPSMLVDERGTDTQWCASGGFNGIGDWNIVVKTDLPSRLFAINLWNGNNTTKYPDRRWKKVKVSGSTSATGNWYEIKTFDNLDLAVNNQGFAGTLYVNATTEYEYYKIEVERVVGGDYMQMSDMKFLFYDTEISGPYKAYFPSSLYGGNKATLPSKITETWTDGKFNMPMYAYSTDTDLKFKNLCGVLKITVKSDQIATVKSISVRSETHAVCGDFEVDADNAAVLTFPYSSPKTLTVTYTDAVPTTEAGKVFYVAVPAQTYHDLKIEIDADGSGNNLIMTTKSEANVTVARNTIYPITFSADKYRGSATKKDGVRVTWVQLWANGPKFAECNVDASSITHHGGYYIWGRTTDKEIGGSNQGGTHTSFYDTATYIWGSNWRMPTQAEFEALLANCNAVWTDNYKNIGGKGVIFTGKGDYMDNSVFFPATGCTLDGGVIDGKFGSYWSSTPDDNERAFYLYLHPKLGNEVNSNYRKYGYAVRAVLNE